MAHGPAGHLLLPLHPPAGTPTPPTSPITLGSTEIVDVRLGTTDIATIYLGTDPIWPA